MTPPEKIRILHLEDSLRDAELIWDMLTEEELAFTVTHALDRITFQSSLTNSEFDIILCDNNLKEYDGFSALKFARERSPLTPFIIISGSMGEDEAVKGLQLGATDYLLKQRLERLVPAIRRALQEAEERRQRKQAEDELRENEERMRLALAATNDAIWDLDLVRNRLVCNETFERVFGRPETPDSRSWLLSRTHPDDREAVTESLTRAVNAGDHHWSADYRAQRADQSWAHVQNRAFLAKDKDGQVVRIIGAIQDVTDSIHAEKERRTLEEQLRQSQKMEAIGTLAGGIAHDFNNILGVILTNAEIAHAELQLLRNANNDTSECLEEILVASERARDLVKQILTFSRRTDSKRVAVDPRAVLRECTRLLRSTLPAMVDLEVDLPQRSSSIAGDRTQLHQVIMNLCTNAWHALPEKGGKITVKLDEVVLEEVLSEDARTLPPGLYIRVRVGDNGCGMKEEVRSRIFEPFFTTKGHANGTGLGLSVVHGIMKSHDGLIRVTSEEGKGSCFELLFPASIDAPESEGRLENIEVVRGSGERILLVDDDRSVARATWRALERSGYRVEVFHAPEAALDALECDTNRCDLLLTDYSMPGMTGLDLAERATQMRPGLPIIMLSGLTESAGRARAQRLGIKAVVEKPIWPDALAKVVGEVLHSHAMPREDKKRILVIDDDEAHLNACARMLRQEGYTVFTANDGDKGLELITLTPLDVVLTDILMPGKEGIEVIMAIRKQYPNLQVIAMSGGGKVRAEHCLELSRHFGVKQTLFKPFSRDELMTALHCLTVQKLQERI